MAESFEDELSREFGHLDAGTINGRFKSPINVSELVNSKATRFEVEPSDEIMSLMDDDELENTIAEDFSEAYNNAKLENTTKRQYKSNKTHSFNELDLSFASFYDQNQVKNMEDIKDGIKKQIVSSGGGILIPENCKVYVHYVCMGEGMTEPFDSTVQRGFPVCVDFRSSDLIAGLYIAIKSMRVKEVAKFWIRYDLAYKETGCPPRIPPSTDIYYIIEVLDIIEEDELKLIPFMSTDERAELEFSEIVTAVKNLRMLGNGEYQTSAYWKAIKKYRKAASILEEYPIIGSEDEKQRQRLLYTLYVNLAQCYIKADRPKQACIACHCGFRSKEAEDSKCPKLFLRFSKAKLMLGHIEDALKHCELALAREPKNSEILAHKAKILKRKKEEEEATTAVYKRMGSAFK